MEVWLACRRLQGHKDQLITLRCGTELRWDRIKLFQKTGQETMGFNSRGMIRKACLVVRDAQQWNQGSWEEIDFLLERLEGHQLGMLH